MKHGPARFAALAATVALVAAACSGSGSSAPPATSGGGGSAPPASAGGGGGTVNIAVNPWVGYTASAAVVAYVLEEKMGYTVNLKDLKEDISWQGFESGEVDVILEDWGHPELEKPVRHRQEGGDGRRPERQHRDHRLVRPDVLCRCAPRDPYGCDEPQQLRRRVQDSESGDKGQFLGTDPSYVQYDEALVENLGLNFEVRFSGSEPATVQAIQQAVDQEKPLLFYWWDPHWLNSQVELTRVPLPPYTEGCDDDVNAIACDYPETPLKKFMRTEFNTTGGDAATMIKNWTWTNDDQNLVADMITNQDMSPEAAAQKWVDENQAKWEAWIP